MSKTVTTADLTTTARKHIKNAIREGLGVNAADAAYILNNMWHMSCLEPGEDLRGIEARVFKDTPIGTKNACFNLFLGNRWICAGRTGSVAVRRQNEVDEAMDQAFAYIRGEIIQKPRIDYRAQRDAREEAGRAGEVVATVVSCEEHPVDPGCARIVVETRDGETLTMAVVPIMDNTGVQNLAFAREKVGEMFRIIWTRAPEFCGDYDVSPMRTEDMGDEMIVDFFLEAPFSARIAA